MLLALLYALYKYQQYMPSDNNKLFDRARARAINYNPLNKTFSKNNIENDIITTDCISQKSIKSLSDIQSNIYNKKKRIGGKSQRQARLTSDGITELLEDEQMDMFDI